MLEGEVHGMIAAEAAAGDGELGQCVAGADEGDEFVDEVVIVLDVTEARERGMDGTCCTSFRRRLNRHKRPGLAVFVAGRR